MKGMITIILDDGTKLETNEFDLVETGLMGGDYERPETTFVEVFIVSHEDTRHAADPRLLVLKPVK